MAIYFISDLHLDKNHPATAKKFLRFLSTEAKNAEALYILGDLFEIWIGDDDLSPFNQKIIRALKNYTDSGIPTYLMHGNRDFLLGKRFLKATGCRLLKDPTLLLLYHIPVLIMHGDLLCTKDAEYLAFRKKIRNPFKLFLFLHLRSLKQRKAFALKLREKSKARYQTINKEMTDVDQEAVEFYMTQYQVRYLIHGHTHRPKIHSFEMAGKPCVRAVLDTWQNEGNVLLCSPTENTQNLDFTLKSV